MRDTLRRLKDGMNSSQRSYGPIYAFKFQEWVDLIARLDGSGLSSVTRFRFRDMNERVMDFYTKFGVLIGRGEISLSTLSDQICEALVSSVETAMEDINHLTWYTWQDFVCVNLQDAPMDRQIFRRRDELNEQGVYWPPQEPEPPVITNADRAQILGFGGDRSEVAGDWVFCGPLGSGNWGFASLWQQRSGAHMLARRIVLKETYIKEFFDDASFWEGPMYRRVIKEESITRYLSKLPGADNIVKSEAVAIYETLKMYRVYMEYCPHSDLEEIIDMDADAEIPERQIWAIFEALVAALCLLKYGSVPPNQQQNHVPILHRDLKPANIFLSAPHG